MAVDSTPGRELRRTTCTKPRNSEAPSIQAASSREIGMESM